MRQSKNIPKALLELPVRVVPGLVLLTVLDYASGGTLWSRLLTQVSAGLLDSNNVWSFAVTAGLVVAIFLGQLLSALGNLVEKATDALLRRSRTSDDFDWLQVNEEHTAELAEEKRAHFKLFNSLAATFLISSIVAVVSSMPLHVLAIFTIASVISAWQGAIAKGAFQTKARKLRVAASVDRESGRSD